MNWMKRAQSVTLAGSAMAMCVMGLLACGGGKGAPDAKAPTTTSQGATPPPAGQPTATLNISNDIMTACNIHVDNPTEAPKFDLDSADVTPEEKDVLSKLATCLTSGPLKGKSLQLVGRADPRGETQYNMALGAGRAKNVAMYLTNLGVEQTRLRETSRGELDATGTDEASWRKDRRVDIKMAN